MDTPEKISMIRDRARKNFPKGFNCAECVFEAVLENVETGLPKESLKLATGFGGGVGLYGDTCGAISGAVLAAELIHGELDKIASQPFGNNVENIQNNGVETDSKN